jgi:6-phosphofructokinase
MKNAFYAQSGGVTAVINASACGVIETARKHSDKIGTVYAGTHVLCMQILPKAEQSMITKRMFKQFHQYQ